ncbi:MAG TPA: hypothetical protein VHY32_04015 [Caulobacteraceae bacterium]|nr:hypothetical protein [Caulobacteraceae bacterium]
MSDINLEHPDKGDHPTTAPTSRMVRWIAAVGVLVVLALGASVVINANRPVAEQVARQNASHSSATPMMAPPPR